MRFAIPSKGVHGYLSTMTSVSGSGRLATLLQVVSLAQTVYDRYAQFREERRQASTYVVRIDEMDDIYLDVQAWLLARLPRRDHRSLVAITSDRSDDSMAPSTSNDDDDALTPTLVRYRYSGKDTLSTHIGGHPIRIWIDRGDGDQEQDSDSRRFFRRPEQIVFEARSQAGLETIKGVIEGIARSKAPNHGPRVYAATSWGYWEKKQALSVKDPSTVVLATGQMERLSRRLGQFLEAEERYATIGIPWHFGILLHGPPGTGKTSAARALASIHNLDVYFMSLASLSSDADLVRLLSNIPDRSMLLLEDTDGSHAATSRDDLGPNRISISALLNALDGVITPHGLVTVMTTNHKNDLDPALLRPGRCDLDEEIGYLTDDQAVRLVGVKTGRAIPLPALGDRKVTPADLVDVVKDHIMDPDAARAAIVDFLLDKTEALNDWQAAA